MTDKPNTRPWDDPEETDEEAMLALLYGKYPRMLEDMEFYVSIMNRGASFSIAIVKVLHWLCLEFIQLHIRTPRWVKVVFSWPNLLGYAAAAMVMWLFVW